MADTNGTSAKTDIVLERQCDVCVVGAGIVGLFTALLLSRRGLKVHVYEKQATVYPLPRAVIFSDEILREFFTAGLGALVSDFVQQGNSTGVDTLEWRSPSHGVLSKFRMSEHGSSGHCAMNVVNQPTFEAALALHCLAKGIPIYRSWAFQSAVDNPSSPYLHAHFARLASKNGSAAFPIFEATLRVRARWLVGADGANSTVRRDMGVDVIDKGFECDWLVVDTLTDPETPEVMPWTQLCDPARPSTILGQVLGRRRFEFMRLPDEMPNELGRSEKIWSLLEPYGLTPANAEIERAAIYTFRAINASRYWNRGRSVIAGDAAHLMPPFIGQGLNSGLRDAISLSWRLSMIEAGISRPEILESYTTERRAHVDEVTDIAIQVGVPLCETDAAKAASMHDCMRRKYLHSGEKPEPLLEARLGQPGAFLPECSGGFLFPQYALLVGEDGAESLLDAVVPSGTWRVLAYNTPWTVDELKPASMAILSRLHPSYFTIAAEADHRQAYYDYFRRHSDSTIALVRPDNYVYAFSSGAADFDSVLDTVPSMLAFS